MKVPSVRKRCQNVALRGGARQNERIHRRAHTPDDDQCAHTANAPSRAPLRSSPPPSSLRRAVGRRMRVHRRHRRRPMPPPAAPRLRRRHPRQRPRRPIPTWATACGKRASSRRRPTSTHLSPRTRATTSSSRRGLRRRNCCPAPGATPMHARCSTRTSRRPERRAMRARRDTCSRPRWTTSARRRAHSTATSATSRRAARRPTSRASSGRSCWRGSDAARTP